MTNAVQQRNMAATIALNGAKAGGTLFIPAGDLASIAHEDGNEGLAAEMTALPAGTLVMIKHGVVSVAESEDDLP